MTNIESNNIPSRVIRKLDKEYYRKQKPFEDKQTKEFKELINKFEEDKKNLEKLSEEKEYKEKFEKLFNAFKENKQKLCEDHYKKLDKDYEKKLNEEYYQKFRDLEGYLEIAGEVFPKPSKSNELKWNNDKTKFDRADLYIYEYLWTLSLVGPLKDLNWFKKLTRRDAILVQVIFHTIGTGYSIRALTATLKPPFKIKRSLIDRVKEIWSITKGIGGVVSKIPGAPKEIGSLISAIGELGEDSTPTYSAYPWYTKTFTAPGGGIGVEWRIDRKIIENIGNRIIGGIGLLYLCDPGNKNQNPVGIEVRTRISFKDSRFSSLIDHPLIGRFSQDGDNTKNIIWIPKEEFGFFADPLILKVYHEPLAKENGLIS